jgi:hypothetical protein
MLKSPALDDRTIFPKLQTDEMTVSINWLFAINRQQFGQVIVCMYVCMYACMQASEMYREAVKGFNC